MPVVLRLKRFGRRHKPFFRLCAMDKRTPRNGQALEELGAYSPVRDQDGKITNFKADRVKHWLSVGAQPSETVMSLLKKAGFEFPQRRQKRTSIPKPKKSEVAAAAAAAAAAEAPAAEAEKKAE